MSNSQGICPKCSAPNEYSKTVCDMCGARLPWADAIKASDKPHVTPSPVPVIAANKKTPPSPESIKGCQKKMGCGCLTIIVLFAFAFLATSGHQSNDGKFDAWYMGKQDITRQLNAPSTAKFAEFNDPETRVLQVGDEWTVSSYVDAQNGFGAMLRRHWIAATKRNSNGDMVIEYSNLVE